MAILAKSQAETHTAMTLIKRIWLVNGVIKELKDIENYSSQISEPKLRACILTNEMDANFFPQVISNDLALS